MLGLRLSRHVNDGAASFDKPTDWSLSDFGIPR